MFDIIADETKSCAKQEAKEEVVEINREDEDMIVVQLPQARGIV
jgi:hypothetical protein